MRVWTIVTVLLSTLIWALPAWCHGVEGHITPAQGYRVTAMYDDGEPMSYAAVEIKGPDSDIAFQTGRADRNGLMMFQPDRPGPWQAVVSDGMGHRLALDLVVPEPDAATRPSDAPVAMYRPSGSRIANTVAGLGIIFGLMGTFYGWRGRRMQRRDNR